MSPLAFVVLVTRLLGPATDPDEPAALSLDWQAPNSCPQREAIEMRLHELLPELDLLAPNDARALLHVEGRLELADVDLWTVSLEFEGDRGLDHREFSGSNCEVLAKAAALVIAVAIDPVSVSLALANVEPKSTERPDEPETSEAIPSPEPEPVPEPSPSPEPDSNQEMVLSRVDDEEEEDQLPAQFVLALVGGGGYGPLRLGQGGLGAEFGVAGPRWRANVRGLWLVRRDQSYAGGVAARFEGFAIAGRGCGVPAIGRLEFPICAGIEGGALQGRGRGSTPEPLKSIVPFVAVVAGPSLRFVLGRFALGADFELAVPLVRGGFTISDSVVQLVTPVGVRGLAAVELRLP